MRAKSCTPKHRIGSQRKWQAVKNIVFTAVPARKPRSFSPRTALGTTRAFETNFCFLRHATRTLAKRCQEPACMTWPSWSFGKFVFCPPFLVLRFGFRVQRLPARCTTHESPHFARLHRVRQHTQRRSRTKYQNAIHRRLNAFGIPRRNATKRQAPRSGCRASDRARASLPAGARTDLGVRSPQHIARLRGPAI